MTSFSSMTWLNPPPDFTIGTTSATLTCAPETDFWAATYYGFTRHSGHFLHHNATGDFTAEVTVEAGYEMLYDQAGLMLRLSDSHWIKAGVEMTDGRAFFSTVVTNGHSDWAVMPVVGPAYSLRLRLTRHAEAIRVQLRDHNGDWTMTRLAYLPPQETVQIGIMACAPQRQPGAAGFQASFRDYAFGPPIDRRLHTDAD